MKKFFTVIFFLLFTVLFTFVLLLGEVNLDILKPAFIKNSLRETQTYRKLVKNPDLLTSRLSGQGGGPLEPQAPGQNAPVPLAPGPGAAPGQTPGIEQKLTQAVLRSINEKWLEDQAEKSIDAIYQYAMSDQQNIKISIDLRDYKARFRNNVYGLMVEEYNKMPEVPLEQFEQQMAQNPGGFPTVRPAGFTMDQMLAKTGLNPVDEIMKNIPDKYDAGSVGRNSPDPTSGLAGLKQIRPVLNIINIVFWSLLTITLVLLLLFAKLTSKTLMEFLMRLGIYLSAALAPLLLFAILWYVLLNILLVGALAGFNMPSAAIKLILEPIAVFMVNRIFLHLVAWSGITGTLGLAMAITTGLILRHKPAVPKPTEAAAGGARP